MDRIKISSVRLQPAEKMQAPAMSPQTNERQQARHRIRMMPPHGQPELAPQKRISRTISGSHHARLICLNPESSRHHITQFDMLEIATISLLPAFANFPVLSSKACFRPFSKLDQPWISSESGHLDSLTVERKKRSIQNPPFQFYPVRKIERSTGQENFESSVMVFFDKGSRLWTSN